MALQKQQVNINFAKGLDTKTDPWQVPIGNFLELQNSVFTKQGQLKKRNGFELIGQINDPSISTITTFNNELTAIGNSIYAYNESSDQFINKGRFQPVDLSVTPGINNGLNQIYSDSAESPNGLLCIVYTEQTTTSTNYKFAVTNKETGQNLIAPQNINPGAGVTVTGPARVFVLENNFIIVFTATAGINNYLKYIAVNFTSLSIGSAVTIANNYRPSAPTNFSITGDILNGSPNITNITTAYPLRVGMTVTSAHFPSNTEIIQILSPTSVKLSNNSDITLLGTSIGITAPSAMTWDGVVCNGSLFIGYDSVSGGGFCVLALKSSLSLIAGTVIDAAHQATIVSACADDVNAYFSYYDYSTGAGYVVGTTIASNAIVSTFVPKQWTLTKFTGDTTGTTTISNISSTANIYSKLQVFLTVPNVTTIGTSTDYWPYISTIPTANSVTTNVVFTGPIVGVQFILGSVLNISSAVSNGQIYIFSEHNNYYRYDNTSDQTNLIYLRTCSTTGTMGTVPSDPIKRGVGLASKAFMVDDIVYSLVVYSQGNSSYPTYQSGYYLIDSNGNVVSKLSYTTGGGYLVNGGVPSVNVNGSVVSCSYLYQNLVRPIAKNNLTQSNNQNLYIYTQTGINVVTFNLAGSGRTATELGSNLNINAGFLWGYDGYKATENGFFVYPDTVIVSPYTTASGFIAPGNYFYVATYEWTDNQGNLFRSAPSIPVNCEIKSGNTFTGNVELLSDVITNLSYTSFLEVGMPISGTGILPAFNVTGDTVISSPNIINIASTANLKVGMAVSGNGIPQYTVIEEITSTTAIKLSKKATATAAGVTITASPAITEMSATSIRISNPCTITANSVSLASGYLGDTSIGSNKITNLRSNSNLQVGMPISGAGIPAGTTITVVSPATPTEITISNNAIATATGVSLSISPKGNAALIYVPNLRLSYKDNVSVVVYRYSDSNPTYYQITSVSSPYIMNPSFDYTVVSDIHSDTGNQPIVGSNILYTTGGVLENISCPAIKTTTIFDNRLWGIDSEKQNLLWYSKQVIQNTPVEMSDLLTFFVSPTQSAQGVTGPITALAPMDDKLIVFKKNAIYYINGIGPNNTGANSQFSEPIFITSTVGTENQNSIVLTPQGLMFQSDKGIWLLGRNLATSYIGAPVESFTESNLVKSAIAVPETNQVRFTMSNNITLMYDYFYEQWGTFTGIKGLFSTIFQNAHTYLTSGSKILQERPGIYTDDSKPTLMSFKTNWFALGGILGFQRAYFMFLLGKYYSPHKLNVSLAYDFNNNATQSIIITPNNYNDPFGGDPFFGSTTPFGGNENIEKWRVMFQRQKCDSIQLAISESYDPSFGVDPGAGLTLSGINLIVGVKRVFNTFPASLTAG